MEVFCKTGSRLTGSWLAMTRGEATKNDIMVGLCCRPSNQEEEVGSLSEQLEDICRSQILVPMGELHLLMSFKRQTKCDASNPSDLCGMLGTSS